MRATLSSSSGRAFTLIEVLVTTSLLSVVMSVLLVGIFSGTRAWDRADRKLESNALVRIALEQFRQDVEHAQTGSMESLEFVLDAEGRPVWTAPTLETRPGSSWQGGVVEAEWVLEKNGESLDWVRRSQPVLGVEPVGPGETRLMLPGVSEITLEFRQQGSWVTVPDGEAPRPDRVRLRLTTVDGAAHEVVARLYPGIYDGALGESGRGGEGDPDEEGEEGETGAGGEDTGEITGGDAETGLEEAVQ